MSDCKERIYKLEDTERFGMNSLLLIIQLKVSKIMETFLPTFIKEVI